MKDHKGIELKAGLVNGKLVTVEELRLWQSFLQGKSLWRKLWAA
ncbi:hypothetical protein TheetDRAFT_3000 [Thermoanaerobacter ethanolicus JW 200]|nr:hypothetical protein TheetDRAFT_3000 [Thermoanaerobacter ethanolicus JW 200]